MLMRSSIDVFIYIQGVFEIQKLSKNTIRFGKTLLRVSHSLFPVSIVTSNCQTLKVDEVSDEYKKLTK